MKLISCGGAKTSWYFLKNYSMISTDAFQVGFLSSLTIVNEGLSLTIVNKTTSFIKTIILKNDRFKNDHLKNAFSIFCRRFHNETIVFQKKKWKR